MVELRVAMSVLMVVAMSSLRASVSHADETPSAPKASSGSPPTRGDAQLEAASPGPEDAASEAFWKANDLYATGEFASAIESFEHAYQLSGEAALLFNIAQCQRKLGACSQARHAFERYEAAEAEPPQAVRHWLDELDVECSQEVADGEPLSATPGVLSSETLPVEDRTNLATASDQAVGGAVGMPLLAAGPKPPTDDAQRSMPDATRWPMRRVLGWSLVGSGALAGGAAIWFGLKANDDREQVEQLTYELTDTGELYDDHVAKIEADRKRHATLATSFGAAALSLGVAGAIVLLTGENAGERDEGSDGLGVVVTPTYSGAAWSGRFGGAF